MGSSSKYGPVRRQQNIKEAIKEVRNLRRKSEQGQQMNADITITPYFFVIYQTGDSQSELLNLLFTDC